MEKKSTKSQVGKVEKPKNKKKEKDLLAQPIQLDDRYEALDEIKDGPLTVFTD